MAYRHGEQIWYRGYLLKKVMSKDGKWTVLDASQFPSQVLEDTDSIKEARAIVDRIYEEEE